METLKLMEEKLQKLQKIKTVVTARQSTSLNLNDL